jgi:hypothetical protein
MGACGRGTFSVVVEVGIDASAADDSVAGGDGDALGGFENAFEHAAEFTFSTGEEAGRVNRAIDGRAVGDFVFLGNQFAAVPADEISFDGVMGADGAAASVAGEIGRERRRRGDLRNPSSGFLKVNESGGFGRITARCSRGMGHG